MPNPEIEGPPHGASFNSESQKQSEAERVRIEQQTRERLWRMAHVGRLADSLLQVEAAWDQGNDEKVLEVLLDYGSDPMRNFLVIDLAGEDEERAMTVYRQLIRSELRGNAFWQEEVDFARRHLALFDEIRERLIGEGNYSRTDELMEGQWRIVVEEGELLSQERRQSN